MTRKDAGNYKAKHSPDVKVDEKIARAVEKKKVDEKISCADAEKIRAALGRACGHGRGL